MPSSTRPVLAIFFVCAAAASAAAQETQNDAVPIETRNYRDLSVPFLRLDPRPWVLSKGEQSITFGFAAANDLRSMVVNGVQKIYEDYENDVLLTRYRKGLGNGFDFTIDVPFISRGGGFMDPIIEGYHELLGFNVGLRNDTSFGQCTIDVPGSGPYHDAAGIGDISAALTKEITPRLMGTVAIKAPTGNAGQILGSGNFDGAMDLQYKFPISSRWTMQVQTGIVGQGASTSLASTRGLVPQAALVLMHRANRFDSYVFQWQSEESATITGVGGSDSSHTTVSVAYQNRISDKKMFEVYFTEDGDWANSYHDPWLANIGPDFTLGVRYTIKW